MDHAGRYGWIAGIAGAVLLARCSVGDDPRLATRDDAGKGGTNGSDSSLDAEPDPDSSSDAAAEASSDADSGSRVVCSDASSTCGTCSRVCAWLVCAAGECDDPVQVAGGGLFTCARRRLGSVYCWGNNGVGQLGRGSDAPSPERIPVRGLEDAVEIATGAAFACARRATGAVVCWGANDKGQLGNPSAPIIVTAPIPVAGLVDAAELALGRAHACARRNNRQVVCWGANDSGQLGDGSTDPRAAPTPVTALTDVDEISTHEDFSCARRGGQVVCWGANDSGILGADAGARSLVPLTIAGVSDAAEMAAGSNHLCIRRANGRVACWGDNDFGQLGNGSYPGLPNSPIPVTVTGVTDAVQIVSGNGHSCARRASGSVLCWGQGTYGALGNDLFANQGAPVSVTGLGSVELGAGDLHTCAVRNDGNVACWGFDRGSGQLGYSTSPQDSSATAYNAAPQPPR